MRRAVAGHMRRDPSGFQLERFVAAMRHGGAALHRPMGGRSSEVERRQMALRISAHQRQGRYRQGDACRLKPDDAAAGLLVAEHYFLQSFKSLSAIENTASALISISRTKHCLEPA